MTNEIEFIEHMQKLELKDGDLIVIKSSMRLSQAGHANIVNSMKIATDTLGIQVQTVILEEGMDIGVLRKAAE